MKGCFNFLIAQIVGKQIKGNCKQTCLLCFAIRAWQELGGGKKNSSFVTNSRISTNWNKDDTCMVENKLLNAVHLDKLVHSRRIAVTHNFRTRIRNWKYAGLALRSLTQPWKEILSWSSLVRNCRKLWSYLLFPSFLLTLPDAINQAGVLWWKRRR